MSTFNCLGKLEINSALHLPQGITKDCEAYALAAGIGVGLVCLGKGSSALDSNVESLLRCVYDTRLICAIGNAGSAMLRMI